MGDPKKVGLKLDLPPTHKIGEYTFTDKNKDTKIDGTDTVRAPGGETMSVAQFEKKFAVQLQQYKEYTKLSDAVKANKLFMPDPEMVSDSMRPVNSMSALEERSTVAPAKQELVFRYSVYNDPTGGSKTLRVKADGYVVNKSDDNALKYLEGKGYSFFKMKDGVRDSDQVFAFKREEVRDALKEKDESLDEVTIGQLMKGFIIHE